jgi:hypothetical protein
MQDRRGGVHGGDGEEAGGVGGGGPRVRRDADELRDGQAEQLPPGEAGAGGGVHDAGDCVRARHQAVGHAEPQRERHIDDYIKAPFADEEISTKMVRWYARRLSSLSFSIHLLDAPARCHSAATGLLPSQDSFPSPIRPVVSLMSPLVSLRPPLLPRIPSDGSQTAPPLERRPSFQGDLRPVQCSFCAAAARRRRGCPRR